VSHALQLVFPGLINSPVTVFTTFPFYSKLMNGSNKLECYIPLGWKGLPGTNTLAYWVNKL
jgi:hypothetical protein